jgi:hypothetical protein
MARFRAYLLRGIDHATLMVRLAGGFDPRRARTNWPMGFYRLRIIPQKETTQ